jgi:hypothetical protein
MGPVNFDVPPMIAVSSRLREQFTKRGGARNMLLRPAPAIRQVDIIVRHAVQPVTYIFVSLAFRLAPQRFSSLDEIGIGMIGHGLLPCILPW